MTESCVHEFEYLAHRQRLSAVSTLEPRHPSGHVARSVAQSDAVKIHARKQKTAMCSRFPNGETRTRTGDTTIFRQLYESLDSRENPATKRVSTEAARRVEVRILHAERYVGHETPLVAQ
jgi:hypothetical protein